MIKVLIVDDEELIRESIAQCLQSIESFDVHTAPDGQKAMEMAALTAYDAFIVDVMMPHVDGIEFLACLCESGNNAIKIVLSGYERFDFAQKAIQYGVSEFILKPITRKDVMDIGHRLKEKISQKQAAEAELALLREQVEVNKPILKERFLEELVLCGYEGLNYDRQKQYFDLAFDQNDVFQVAVLEFQDSNNMHYRGGELSIQAIGMSFIRIAQECSEREVDIIGFRTARGHMVLLFCMKDISPRLEALVESKLAQIIDNASGYLMLSFYGGLGCAYHGVKNIYSSYMQAINALRYNALFTCASFICIKDIESDSDQNVDFVNDETMLSNIKLGLCDEVLATINDYFVGETGEAKYSMQTVRLLAMKVLLACMGALLQLGLSTQSINTGEMQDIIQSNFEPGKQVNIQQALETIVSETVSLIQSARNEKSNFLVERAQKYIDEHFCDDIMIKDIADALFVSKNYLGQLFKQNTGLSVSNYMNNLRVKKAMELLSETNMKIYEVANAVGYCDQHYFSAIYKKYTGVSPSEYRDLVK